MGMDDKIKIKVTVECVCRQCDTHGLLCATTLVCSVLSFKLPDMDIAFGLRERCVVWAPQDRTGMGGGSPGWGW